MTRRFNAHLLVEPDWLAARLNDGDTERLRVVDARPLARYRSGHLPYAVSVPMLSLLVVDKGLRQLAPFERLEALFGAAGIDEHTTVVIYGERGSVDAANAFWALECCGHPEVRVLNGGIERWERQGRPLTTEAFVPKQKSFRAKPIPKRRVEGDWLLEHLHDPDVQVLDNRTREEYTGEECYAQRGGHIPGARLLPYDATLQPDGSFKSPVEIARLYEQLDLDFEKTLVNYCQSGTRSAHAYFTQRLVGFRDPRVYEGSWAEWGNEGRFPVER